MRKFVFGLILMAALVILMPVSPVMAILDPDSPPSVNSVIVYEFDDGSIGVLVAYELEYAATPAETATEAYLCIFIDTDGSTQLKPVAPYAYDTSGYGFGYVWIPFTADEVTTYGINEADEALYRVWLMGNPTVASGWAGDPPKTIALIDSWLDSGDGFLDVLLALDVLQAADGLTIAWGYNLIESTSIGNRLTTAGAAYFENVIPGLRLLAPACFSSYVIEPTIEDIDYTTEFGAYVQDYTGNITGSPQTLAEGNNNVDVTNLGMLYVVLSQGTSGNATTDVCTVDGSPVDLVAGTNNITVSGVIGNIVVSVELIDTTTQADDLVAGTGWDLTTLGATFGMSRWQISGIVWFILSVVITAAFYRITPERFGGTTSGKILFPVFMVCIVGGMLLGLLKPIVGILIFIGIAGFFVGYILYFRNAGA